MTLNHENRVRGMTLEEARVELAEWKEAYQAESQAGAPDEEFMGRCLYMSGFTEAHIDVLKEKEAWSE